MSVVLYGLETWSLTLREEGRLKVFENRVLRGIFVPMWDKVTGGWRKLLNEELNDLCCAHNIVEVMKSRRMRLAGHVARIRERRGAYRVLVGNLRARDNLENPGVDVRIVLKWMFRKWDWIDLSQYWDRWRSLVNVVMNF